jgi:hypothetical protein
MQFTHRLSFYRFYKSEPQLGYIVMFIKRFKQFLDSLPVGRSSATSTRGDAIVLDKTVEGHILLSVDATAQLPAMSAADQERRFFYSFTSAMDDAYVLEDCWEETDESRHYPVTYTSLFMAEQIIAEIATSHEQATNTRVLEEVQFV